MQKGFAELLGVPLEQVRVIWVEDAGSYGRPGFEDAAADAVLLSHAVGKPVRVQWMRADMTAWGPRRPPWPAISPPDSTPQGEVTALQFTSHAFSGGEVHYQPATRGQFSGQRSSPGCRNRRRRRIRRVGRGDPAVQASRISRGCARRAAFFDTTSPLRSTHLRDPEGPATSFAIESFMDEVAAAAGATRSSSASSTSKSRAPKPCSHAAAEKGRLGQAARRRRNAGPGRHRHRSRHRLGHAQRHLCRHGRGSRSQPPTGVVRVTRFVCAHDCGLIINPDALRSTIAANLVQSMSRALKEEVTFDRNNVTSVDWGTYPVARASDIPAQVDIVLINHPELPPGGAGEPSPRHRRSDRQRDLRRHRRARPPSAD